MSLTFLEYLKLHSWMYFFSSGHYSGNQVPKGEELQDACAIPVCFLGARPF